ncbi:MAG: hypothetical protein NTY66_02565 [Candidatus Vogelbacteria bacterium]|nr:hypothetical protein [Candidatus Vogelbacteria bacterium]
MTNPDSIFVREGKLEFNETYLSGLSALYADCQGNVQTDIISEKARDLVEDPNCCSELLTEFVLLPCQTDSFRVACEIFATEIQIKAKGSHSPSLELARKMATESAKRPELGNQDWWVDTINSRAA